MVITALYTWQHSVLRAPRRSIRIRACHLYFDVRWCRDACFRHAVAALVHFQVIFSGHFTEDTLACTSTH